MQPLKVLVVEDEIILLVDIVDLVEDSGFRALEAQNADAAMILLQQHTDIDVLITDIDMPGSMDGLELARRARGIYPDMAVVVISGKLHASKNDVPPRGRFIPKPYPRLAIMEVLKALATPSYH
ncbi:response regulator [Rhizobiaceae bacterium CRRU44]|uniref:Response regulator n=1 Tax=Ferranicluibacter rubi TaxID=2715133 RepID=A0AA44CF40_9HYPH|nr:response regulator [Ferranicluibacter rubi]NHT78782.1 response regulator [Ferranicluibacter rubi]